MKIHMFLAAVVAVTLAGNLWAADGHPSHSGSPESGAKGKTEGKRRKRATICAECGKPEAECECGHADGGKSAPKEEHGPGDGHKH